MVWLGLVVSQLEGESEVNCAGENHRRSGIFTLQVGWSAEPLMIQLSSLKHRKGRWQMEQNRTLKSIKTLYIGQCCNTEREGKKLFEGWMICGQHQQGKNGNYLTLDTDITQLGKERWGTRDDGHNKEREGLWEINLQCTISQHSIGRVGEVYTSTLNTDTTPSF